ncbi:pentapeptide repeat-containing protein [uncultured Pelagimonas sp.]|uniref:pentapeptide repeat-containing protein n=1 Tax=uncultured Pelagimonas sp. TaxID=1618102 RepID=UPI00261BE348|nr:pentapeptide repeat-containing protein [uncultured Pelagimonas sp.]
MADTPDPSPILFHVSITSDDFWTGLAVLAFTLFLIIFFAGVLFPTREERPDWLNRLQKWQGMETTNSGLFLGMATLTLVAGLIWAALLSVLVFGLFGLLINIPDMAPPENKEAQTAFRFLLAQIAGLTAVTGAVIALPFTVIRLRLTQQQTDTARAALFNNKITEAAADLHAMRQVSKKVGENWETLWEDDVVRRNAAIDRLEGLVREEPEEAERVSRLLSVYVRELSKVYPAQQPPETEDDEKLREWSRTLKISRSDLENAVQVLGRLAQIDRVDATSLAIDLSAANLQAMDLQGLSFDRAQLLGAQLQGAKLIRTQLQGAQISEAQLQRANLREAQLQEANLSNAQLQGAMLSGAQLQGANLFHAQMTGADLFRAQLQRVILNGARLQGANLRDVDLMGADLREAQLQGADLSAAKFDPVTSLTAATLQGAAVSFIDFTNTPQIIAFLDDIFGDGSTKLPAGTKWPKHWPKETLHWPDFKTQWRAWAKTKGIDIPD